MTKFIVVFILSFYANAQVPNFEYLQKYLEPAPVGVDARYAWTLPGGTGENVKFIDIETGVYLYDDLPAPFILNSTSEQDHGSAVIGTLVAKNDGIGTTGIVYDASWGFFSNYYYGYFPSPTSTSEQRINTAAESLSFTIKEAIKELSKGDVLIIEVQFSGPYHNFAPVEYWPQVYNALKIATKKGIHCVAAAGNGGHSLDGSLYKGAFNRRHRDSGCILVASATLEPTNDSRGHRKVTSSNYGSRIDVHGYGKNVTTVGYGNLYDNKNSKYTRFFAGTSSATAIVAGVVASLSSIAKEQGKILSPRRIRKALRKTGTPQYAPRPGYDERKYPIGNLPDLKALVKYFRLN